MTRRALSRLAGAKGGVIMKKGLICAAVILAVVLPVAQAANAQQVPPPASRAGKFVFGAGLGLQGDTPDATAFSLGLSGDYFLTHEVSIGPLLQMGFTGDLFQLGLSAQAKYTLDLPQIPKLKPHFEAGIGFAYADLDQGGNRDADDASFIIPVGVGAEYKLSERVSLDTTLFFNFTDLNVRDENFFITWLVGVKIPF
jgi:opacity protein-like surface antigen